MSFLVVVFTDENETALVPDNWVDGTESYWPPYKSSHRVNSAVQKREVPGEMWTNHPIRVLFTGSWEEARAKLKKSEETSDLQSEAEELIQPKRLTRQPKRFLTDSESDEEYERQPAHSPSQPPPQKQLITSPRQSFSPSLLATRLPNEMSPVPPPKKQSISASRQSLPSPVQTTSNVILPRQAEARDVRIFTMLEKILEEMAEHKRLLRQGNACRVAENVAEATLPDDCVLPLRTVSDVEKFEEQMENSQAFKAMVRYLAEFGGHSVRDSIYRMLKEVMVTDLARLYNLHGHKNKLQFSKLRLSAILYKCVQRNSATKNCSKKEVEEAIVKWLSGARDRDGGRKRRTSQPQNDQPVNTLEEQLKALPEQKLCDILKFYVTFF